MSGNQSSGDFRLQKSCSQNAPGSIENGGGGRRERAIRNRRDTTRRPGDGSIRLLPLGAGTLL